MSEQLAKAVRTAQTSRLNLAGLMAAHGIDPEELRLMLPQGWPDLVKHAFATWQSDQKAVAQLLARQAGAEQWHLLPEPERIAWFSKAFSLVMDSPMDPVPHSSTPPLPS